MIPVWLPIMTPFGNNVPRVRGPLPLVASLFMVAILLVPGLAEAQSAASDGSGVVVELTLSAGVGGFVHYRSQGVQGTVLPGTQETLPFPEGAFVTLEGSAATGWVAPSWHGTVGSSATTLQLVLLGSTTERLEVTRAPPIHITNVRPHLLAPWSVEPRFSTMQILGSGLADATAVNLVGNGTGHFAPISVPCPSDSCAPNTGGLLVRLPASSGPGGYTVVVVGQGNVTSASTPCPAHGQCRTSAKVALLPRPPTPSTSLSQYCVGPVTLTSVSAGASATFASQDSSASLTLDANVSLGVDLSVCLVMNSLAPAYLNISSSLTESASIGANVSAALSYSDANTPYKLAGPWYLGDACAFLVVCVDVQATLDAEVEASVTAAANVSVNQGLTASAQEDYAFGTGTWASPSPTVSCTVGSPQTGCVSVTASAMVQGLLQVRAGPILALAIWGVAGPYVFAYGQLNFTAGISTTPGPVSGCGSASVGLGVALTPWVVACTSFGVQIGFQTSFFGNDAQNYPALDETLIGVPIGATVVACDQTQSTCASAQSIQTGAIDTLNVTGAVSGLTFAWSSSCGTLSAASGATVQYTAPSSAGSCTVRVDSGLPLSSAALHISKSQFQFTVTSTPPPHTVTFSESGLPAGTSWTVAVNGTAQASTTSTIAFSLPAYHYAFTVGTVPGYSVSTASGSFTISSSDLKLAEQFTVASTYQVGFTESGLPTGTSWTVALGASTQSSSTQSMDFLEANGSLSYMVGSVQGYASTPSVGSLRVAGSAVTVSISLAAVVSSYPVTFGETGAPSGSNWSVTLGAMSSYTTGTNIMFSEPNGTYYYTIGPPPFYRASQTIGSVTVSGGSQSVSVTFGTAPVYSEWTQLSPSTSPSARYNAAITYDAADSYVLLFGGCTSTTTFCSTYLSDTWNYSSGTWTKLSPATSPSARAGARMAYDAKDGYVVLFGGYSSSGGFLNDTWTFKGGAWKNISASLTTTPQGREGQTMVYDPATKSILMLSGCNTTATSTATYDYQTFSSGSWSGASYTNTWGYRWNGGATYDAADYSVLAYGGYYGSCGFTTTSSLVDYDNGTFTSGASSYSLTGPALAYDPTTAYPLYFGGCGKIGTTTGAQSVTEVYHDVGVSPQWNGPFGLTGSTPTARCYAQIVYDASDTQLLMFGGWTTSSTLSDTWIFIGSLNVHSFVPTPSVITLGHSTTLQTGILGGLSPYKYTYAGLPPGCVSSNTASLSCTPTTVGSYTIDVTVNDSSSSVQSYTASTTLTVNPTPTFPVVFNEAGLPTGSSWSVVVNSSTFTSNASTLTVYLTNGSYAFTVTPIPGYTLAPTKGTFNVTGTSLALSVVFSRVGYSVAFFEKGLPVGSLWQVDFAGLTINRTTNATSTTLTFGGLGNGSYGYSITDVSGWHQRSIPYSSSLRVNGSAVTVRAYFHRVVYSVAFLGYGLPMGVQFHASFGTSGRSVKTTGSPATLSFGNYSNGSYGYALGGVSGYHERAIPYNGTLSLAGAALREIVFFVPFTITVTFAERGLPAGTNWKATFGGFVQNVTVGASSSTLTWLGITTNRTYRYSLADVGGWHQTSVPYSGKLAVKAVDRSVNLSFNQTLYSVTFQESGLPNGTSWSITTGGVTHTSTAASLVVSLANGTSIYSVGSPTGYTTRTSGTVTVKGHAATVLVPFKIRLFTVTFVEHGLNNKSTPWNVTIGNVTKHGFGNSTNPSFTLANGTYNYTIGNVPGYTATKSSGQVTVSGSSVRVSVKFA